MQERGDIASKQLSLVDRRLYLVNDLSNRKKGSLSSVSIPKSLAEALSPMAHASVTAPGSAYDNRSETELVGSASTESRLPSSPYLVLSR